MTRPRFNRILLKLSGEALMGQGQFGIDPDAVDALAREVLAAREQCPQLCLVVGGGNIFRGMAAAAKGFDLFFEPSEAVVKQRSSVWDTLFANTKDELVIDMTRWQSSVTTARSIQLSLPSTHGSQFGRLPYSSCMAAGMAAPIENSNATAATCTPYLASARFTSAANNAVAAVVTSTTEARPIR